MDMELVKSFLVDVGIALLGLASAYAVLYLNKATAKVKEEIGKIQDEKQRALINAAIDRVNDLAFKSVSSVEQSSAKALREAVKAGIEDRQKLLDIGKSAVEDVYNQLSPDAIALLENEVTDVKKYIMNCVESEVLKIKK
jgi:adenylate kinase